MEESVRVDEIVREGGGVVENLSEGGRVEERVWEREGEWKRVL